MPDVRSDAQRGSEPRPWVGEAPVSAEAPEAREARGGVGRSGEPAPREAVASRTRALGASAPLIELAHITKIYVSGETELRALDDVSLVIPAGQFVAVMGASGSGKSTLMNVIGCLDRPTRGVYRLLGREISGQSANELAEIRNRLLGFVFQSFNLLSRTSARENVELPLLYAGVPTREREARALAALARVGLADRASHTPGQLSGGQQQRVAIARALVNDPRVILADEPTGQLDSRASMELMRLLQELARAGITIVLVTHEADIGRCAERVITMRDGRIVADLPQVPVSAAA